MATPSLEHRVTYTGPCRSPPLEETFVRALGHKAVGKHVRALVCGVPRACACAGVQILHFALRGWELRWRIYPTAAGDGYMGRDAFDPIAGDDGQWYACPFWILLMEGYIIILPNVSTEWNLSQTQVVQWKREP
jgi:hypothetical protein